MNTKKRDTLATAAVRGSLEVRGDVEPNVAYAGTVLVGFYDHIDLASV